MTGAELGEPEGVDPVAGGWRTPILAAQRAALPAGSTMVSCRGRWGNAGLGRHLAELAQTLDEQGRLRGCLCRPPLPAELEGSGRARAVEPWELPGRLLGSTVLRWAPGWRVDLENRRFDRAGARRLPGDVEQLLVFVGHARHHVERARRSGCRSVGLVAATSHFSNVVRRYEEARRRYPVERPWGRALAGRALREYPMADWICVGSRYAWETFVEAGYPEDRLRLFPLLPHPRFSVEPTRRPRSTFDVVYTGSLAVTKGVPLLIEAFRSLPLDDARLVLVGGYGTPGMRRLVGRSCAEDRRILVRPGDPLPWLRGAALYVHPSYQEGFGYGPAEALACGVPTVVTEDTGMKDMEGPAPIRVVPTGDLDAVRDAIADAHRGDWPR